MRALLVWVGLVVVFDLGGFVALRDVVQPARVSADLGPTPGPDACGMSSPSNVACITGVQRHAAMEPTQESMTCNNVLVQVDPKTLDQICDLMSTACDQQAYARICPPLSDPQRDGH